MITKSAAKQHDYDRLAEWLGLKTVKSYPSGPSGIVDYGRSWVTKKDSKFYCSYDSWEPDKNYDQLNDLEERLLSEVRAQSKPDTFIIIKHIAMLKKATIQHTVMYTYCDTTLCVGFGDNQKEAKYKAFLNFAQNNLLSIKDPNRIKQTMLEATTHKIDYEFIKKHYYRAFETLRQWVQKQHNAIYNPSYQQWSVEDGYLLDLGLYLPYFFEDQEVRIIFNNDLVSDSWSYKLYQMKVSLKGRVGDEFDLSKHKCSNGNVQGNTKINTEAHAFRCAFAFLNEKLS